MAQRNLFDDEPRFGGVTYDATRDAKRLSGALARVYWLMLDGRWHTIEEVARECQCSEAGASARLRDLRKDKFREQYPNREVQRRNVGGGLWEYRLIR